MLRKKTIITQFKNLFSENQDSAEKRHDWHTVGRFPGTKMTGYLQPVFSWIALKCGKRWAMNINVNTFEFKTRVGKPADATRYKKFLKKFEKCSPQE
jgi:hypothetical protein